MYIVLSNQNGRDTSVPDIAPRLLTEDPLVAVHAARQTFEDDYEPFVARTIIYRMEPEMTHSVKNSTSTNIPGNEAPHIVAYVAWNHPSTEGKLVENFYDEQLANAAGVQLRARKTA